MNEAISQECIIVNKIYYITRSYHPYDAGGGALMRTWAVNNLRELGWKVIVVRPDYTGNELRVEEDMISIPLGSLYSQKLFSLLERFGIIEDYLDLWIAAAFNSLRSAVTKDDLVFATSGGELSTIKLASLLKLETNCKYIANFRDPLNYGYMQGLRRDKKFHVGKISLQKKYLENVDLILTSSIKYAEIMKEGFPQHRQKIFNNYFGYGAEIDYQKTGRSKWPKNVNIVYAGNLSATQAPEIILDVVRNKEIKNLKITFIGERLLPSYDLRNLSVDVEFKEHMPHKELVAYMKSNADIAMVSLAREYYSACVPSKLYEYLALKLPILGFLPYGDASQIINDNGFGIATEYGDLDGSYKALLAMMDREQRTRFKQNIIEGRDSWSMKRRILEVDGLLKSVMTL